MRKLTSGSVVLAAAMIASVLSGCGAGSVAPVSDVRLSNDAAAQTASAADAARTTADERAAAEAAAESAAAATAEAAAESAAAAAAAPVAPSLTVACPTEFRGDDQWVDTSFGYGMKAYPPFRVRIDYGDGKSYENDDQHLAEVFSHRYTAPGQYKVVASVTDAQGGTATATCMDSWIPPSYVPVTPAIPVYPGGGAPAGIPGGGYPVTCSDGWSSSSGGKSGACSSHGGVG